MCPPAFHTALLPCRHELAELSQEQTTKNRFKNRLGSTSLHRGRFSLFHVWVALPEGEARGFPSRAPRGRAVRGGECAAGTFTEAALPRTRGAGGSPLRPHPSPSRLRAVCLSVCPSVRAGSPLGAGTAARCEWAARYFMNGAGHVLAAPPRAALSHSTASTGAERQRRGARRAPGPRRPLARPPAAPRQGGPGPARLAGSPWTAGRRCRRFFFFYPIIIIFFFMNGDCGMQMRAIHKKENMAAAAAPAPAPLTPQRRGPHRIASPTRPRPQKRPQKQPQPRPYRDPGRARGHRRPRAEWEGGNGRRGCGRGAPLGPDPRGRERLPPGRGRALPRTIHNERAAPRSSAGQRAATHLNFLLIIIKQKFQNIFCLFFTATNNSRIF